MIRKNDNILFLKCFQAQKDNNLKYPRGVKLFYIERFPYKVAHYFSITYLYNYINKHKQKQ